LLANAAGEWIAIVSGLDVGSKKPDNHKHDIRLQLLVEFLASELGSAPEQQQSTCVSRLIIAGDSFAPEEPAKEDQESLIPSRLLKNRPQPTVSTETHPTEVLGGYLLDIGRSMPIHIMPGDRDPAPVILPQQPFPRAMLGGVKKFKTFKCETNPSWYSFEGCQ
jgi:DNA polymerase delta subunit 2